MIKKPWVFIQAAYMNIGPGFLNQVPTEANEVKLESMGKTVKSKCKTLITVTPVVPYEQTPLNYQTQKNRERTHENLEKNSRSLHQVVETIGATQHADYQATTGVASELSGHRGLQSRFATMVV